MRVLFIVKNHPRNIQICLEFVKKIKNIKTELILMPGDSLLPSPPEYLSLNLKKLWKLHFSKRYDFEKLYFDNDLENIKLSINNFIKIQSYDFKICEYLKKNRFDICFVSGVKIIPSKVLKLLPVYTINFHLGFIPYYKGTITTFWPFYFLEPHMLATTFHVIDEKVDCGEIIEINFPKLIKSDSLHESSCKAIINGQLNIDKIYKHCLSRIENKKTPSKNSELYYQGKMFRNKDWKPEMLQFIYEVHKDEIVKNFYNPQLIKGLNYTEVNEKYEKEKKTIS
jgi:folate-dependent phosphoribosylglycinamide formyltransferase PurN